VLPANQTCVEAPYVIRETDLELPAVKRQSKAGVQYHQIRDKEHLNINEVGR
jgi:hypothetical protein